MFCDCIDFIDYIDFIDFINFIDFTIHQNSLADWVGLGWVVFGWFGLGLDWVWNGLCWVWAGFGLVSGGWFLFVVSPHTWAARQAGELSPSPPPKQICMKFLWLPQIPHWVPMTFRWSHLIYNVTQYISIMFDSEFLYVSYNCQYAQMTCHVVLLCFRLVVFLLFCLHLSARNDLCQTVWDFADDELPVQKTTNAHTHTPWLAPF